MSKAFYCGDKSIETNTPQAWEWKKYTKQVDRAKLEVKMRI